MKSRIGASAVSSKTTSFATAKDAPATAVEDWEVRPCGMLVQRRNKDAGDAPVARIPTIRVKVKHGAVTHEIYVSAQGTFGELKKALSVRTGLHPLDQKLIYKDRERDSSAFLDTAGVKDKSKLVLVEDPVAQAKRLLEQRKTEKMEKAAKLISAISLEVGKLASKVSALEAIANKGGRIVVTDVDNLIELLMNELIKLDAVVADGDVKQQRRLQVKRVQKHVETLDMIKAKNSVNTQPKAIGQVNNNNRPQQNPVSKLHEQQKYNQQIHAQPNANSQVNSNNRPQQNPLSKSLQEQQKYIQLKQQSSMQTQQFQQTHILYQQHSQQKAETHFEPMQQQQKQAATQTSDWDILDSLFVSSTTVQAPTSVRSTSVASTPTTRFDWELF